MSSGTSVPEPRTWRSIEPRFTASIQTTARSTVGAAGFSFETPSEMPTTTMMATVAYAIRLIFFLRAWDGRAISTIYLVPLMSPRKRRGLHR